MIQLYFGSGWKRHTFPIRGALRRILPQANDRKPKERRCGKCQVVRPNRGLRVAVLPRADYRSRWPSAGRRRPVEREVRHSRKVVSRVPIAKWLFENSTLCLIFVIEVSNCSPASCDRCSPNSPGPRDHGCEENAESGPEGQKSFSFGLAAWLVDLNWCPCPSGGRSAAAADIQRTPGW